MTAFLDNGKKNILPWGKDAYVRCLFKPAPVEAQFLQGCAGMIKVFSGLRGLTLQHIELYFDVASRRLGIRA